VLEQLRGLPATTVLRLAPYAVIAAILIGVPSDLIDTSWFGRPVEIRAIDYVIWVITSLLIGLIFAIRVDSEVDETRTVWGGFMSFLAIGCPVCNQAVVALAGTSGALSWWAPVQPVVGLLAVAILLYALKQRLATYALTSCALPSTPAGVA
jgi:hypothetical protein